MNPQELAADLLAADLAALHRSAVHGCGNHNCVIKQPDGMATNGPCRCRPRDFARTLRTLADVLLVDTRDRLGYEWPAPEETR